MRRVVDGDTLVLRDGRRVRLIGVDAPELGRAGQPAEPLARVAKGALQSMVDGAQGQILWLAGTTPKDAFGRHLLHLYLPNGDSITARLLAQGLGHLLLLPPNVRDADCLASQVHQAQSRKLGLWAPDRSRRLAVTRLNHDGARDLWLEGRLTRFERSKGNLYLWLDGRLRIKVTPADLAPFLAMDLQAWIGRSFRVFGRVYGKKGRYYMRLRHPAELQSGPFGGQ